MPAYLGCPGNRPLKECLSYNNCVILFSKFNESFFVLCYTPQQHVLTFDFPSLLTLSSTANLSFVHRPLRIDPLHFQARGCRRQPNLFFNNCFSSFYVTVFLFLVHDYLCSVSLGLLHIFVVILLVFDFCFLSTSQEIGREEHVQSDLLLSRGM